MVGPFLLVVFADKIAFHAVDDLDIELIGFDDLGSFRKCLYDAVVGYGNSRPAPAGGCRHELLYGNHRIHITHMCMCMQFHPLDLRMILTLRSRHLIEAVRHQDKIVLEFIKLLEKTGNKLH